VWVPLASLVSCRVFNYPMEALKELEALLIVSLGEGEIEGGIRAERGNVERAQQRLQDLVSGADICTQLDLNFTRT